MVRLQGLRGREGQGREEEGVTLVYLHTEAEPGAETQGMKDICRGQLSGPLPRISVTTAILKPPYTPTHTHTHSHTLEKPQKPHQPTATGRS